jgi:FkbM family methyltransferase
MGSLRRSLRKLRYRALGYYPVRIGEVELRCDPYHLDFWRDVARGRWEPDTYRILSRFLAADAVYCDVGAWIGPTVLYAAKLCKKVLCFEPDPFAYEYLLTNLRLNGARNVLPFHLALGESDGMKKIGSFGEELGDSRTSLLPTNRPGAVAEVLCLTWESWLSLTGQGAVDLLKIDIEGGEFSFVPTLKRYLERHKPVVYLSTHAPYLEQGARREGMQRLFDSLGMYRRCCNERMETVESQEFVSDAALGSFSSYVFMD